MASRSKRARQSGFFGERLRQDFERHVSVEPRVSHLHHVTPAAFADRGGEPHTSRGVCWVGGDHAIRGGLPLRRAPYMPRLRLSMCTFRKWFTRNLVIPIGLNGRPRCRHLGAVGQEAHLPD